LSNCALGCLGLFATSALIVHAAGDRASLYYLMRSHRGVADFPWIRHISANAWCATKPTSQWRRQPGVQRQCEYRRRQCWLRPMRAVAVSSQQSVRRGIEKDDSPWTFASCWASFGLGY